MQQPKAARAEETEINRTLSEIQLPCKIDNQMKKQMFRAALATLCLARQTAGAGAGTVRDRYRYR